MKDKINIAELLKDCPKGMELDCASYDNVSFDKISDDKKATYPIFCYITDEEGNRSGISFTENGCESKRRGAKCVIFPKGKTTWEGFQIPFKDGDIVAGENCACSYTAIFRKFIDDTSFSHHACLTGFGKFKVDDFSDNSNLRFATEEEKEKLFDAIKSKGYKWNPKTKTLEKLPKFKIGDRVKHISAYTSGIVVKISDKGYHIDYPKGEGICYISFELEKDYELASNKFDITTLKPFDKVLVRCNSLEKWHIQFFEKYNTELGAKYPFICLCNSKYCQCIPYEGNEHLLGTTNDCDDFYKTW